MKKFGVAAFLTAIAVLTQACPEKKEPPKPAPEPKAEVKPTPPPPPVVVERADKECAAPIDPGPTSDVKVAERAAKRSGARLSFVDKDADGTLTFGVLGPVNEDSGENMVALKRYMKFFQEQKVDAIVVTGDVGEVASGITRVLTELASAKVPVFVVIGNRECRAEFTDGVAAAATATNGAVVSLSDVRVVEFPELTLISLPGHYNAEYRNCTTGCLYLKSTIDEVMREAKASKTPVALVTHGGPKGKTNQALDFAANNGGNVGDEELTKALAANPIAFGFFSNIKEAGARATADIGGENLVNQKAASKSLFLNPGPADTVGWDMNDGSKSSGMAAVFKLTNGEAQWELFRMKPLTAAEKAEAKKLAPPPAPAPANDAPPTAPVKAE